MQQPHINRPSSDGNVGTAHSPVDRHQPADSQPPRKKPPWRLVIGIAAAVIVVILGAVATFPAQFKHQLEISIVRQPTPYTQLYFTNPSALSGKLEVGKKNTFEFSVENDESRTYTYTYTVTLDDSRSHLTVSRTSATLGSGDRVTRTVTFVPKDRKSQYLVTVALEGINQSIHFYGQTS